ncbi:phosphate signaling complex protein PhoU [Carboxydocella sp. ULO1]|uniref:phosphate signaling complex protein PhoU n=1 Tax=Carboxydocella sp. ULO1 TaxID=1926599 RepID=UPI0009ADB4E4|nr:phosphate signaling complex protein PhoU [Carboxydocella sp. ULO1]GAW27799.1 PhoU family transcriptional regulator [Carboxydocella sp. ULO1]
MSSSVRHNFDQALEELQKEILRMGSMVETAIAKAVESLAKQDVKLAQEVIEGDEAIDELEKIIDDRCMKLIATQQPIAGDLRKIGAGLKIIVDLERIADHAADIAKVTLRLANQPLIKPLIDIPKMAKLAQEEVRGVLDAYVRGDVELAKATCAKDDEIDRLYRLVFDELVEIMQKDPSTITQATYLLFVARYLERIGDHATNIGEGVIYLETGEREDLNR